jgi:hypothetical protein
MSSTRLEEASLDELIAEVKKRNLGCIISAMRVGSNNTLDWVCSPKGSEETLRALTVFSMGKVTEAIVANQH